MNIIKEYIEVAQRCSEECQRFIEAAAQKITETLQKGKKVLICGNGGSAADAQHFAAELQGKFLLNRKPLAAIALTTNTSTLTAIGNDFGFEEVFERQVEGLGQEGDILVGLSTSGNSENVIKAMKRAKEKGLHSIAFLGRDGGKMKGVADIEIIIPSEKTYLIQEFHEILYHRICKRVEESIFKES